MRTINVYKFEELNWKAQDMAEEQFREEYEYLDEEEAMHFTDLEHYIISKGYEFSEYGYRIW